MPLFAYTYVAIVVDIKILVGYLRDVMANIMCLEVQKVHYR